MSDNENITNKQSHNRLIIAIVSLSHNLIIHQINITSKHFAVAFNIPLHNVSIYFGKLYSIRCILILVGLMIEYVIFLIAGGDYTDVCSTSGDETRKYVGIISSLILTLVRIIFLVILHYSSQLGYYIYKILAMEAFIYGLNDGVLFSRGAEHTSTITLFFNVARVLTLFFQFVLDLFLRNSLLIVQIQIWICNIISMVSSGLWIHYNLIYKQTCNMPQKVYNSNNNQKQTNDNINDVISPFAMFITQSIFKDFLTPTILPFAILHRDKCHTINKLSGLVSIFGPLIFFFLDSSHIFKKWEWYYNGFFILLIPMLIIFIYCFMAIHTQIPSAVKIRNSRPRVMIMTLVIYICSTFLEPLSFIGVAKYAVRKNPYGFTIQGIHKFASWFTRSFVSRVSIGYEITVVSLGYHLPKFRPTHRMSKSNLAWYVTRQTFRRSWIDFKDDLKLDLKKYL